MRRIRSILLLLGLALFCQPARADEAATAALAEVNAVRAARGLPPFAEDPGLTAAAQAAADYRAAHLMEGHTANDFQFLPTGAHADAAGCAAWQPSWGWGSCCMYENWTYAGAAWALGRDGRRYMHLFVRRGARRPLMGGEGVALAPTYAATALETSACATGSCSSCGFQQTSTVQVSACGSCAARVSQGSCGSRGGFFARRGGRCRRGR